MTYAAWSKGTAALLLAIRDVARGERRLGRPAGRVARVGAGAAGAARGGRALGRGEGLALDRRDGGDRRHVRGRGRSPRASIAPRPRSTARDSRRAGSRSATASAASSRASTSISPTAASCSSPGRTGPARRRSCACSPGSPRRPPASSSFRRAGRSATSAHEPLVYRELTPLENLTLFARLYRIPERGERVGMLLERFGLWDVRHERVSSFSRGMQQRLGLCRVLLHEPALLLLDEPYNALDADGARVARRAARGAEPRVRRRDARSRSASSGSRPSGWPSHDVRPGCRRARAQGSAARVAREGDAAVDAAVRRRDADDLSLRAAARQRRRRRRSASSGRRSSSRRSSGSPAPSSPSASRGCSTRSCSRRATAARSGSAKTLSVLAFLVCAEIVALPAFAAFFSGVDGRTVAAVALADVGICCGRDALRCDGGRGPRP